MEQEKCPNAEGCILIHNVDFVTENQRNDYMKHFCFSENKHFTHCKRYQTSVVYHFCPDFVLPDSDLTLDEIIDRYEEETE